MSCERERAAGGCGQLRASWLCLSSKVMLFGLLVGGPGTGPAAVDDNRGEVDVVGLITHSEERTQSLYFRFDAATLPASASARLTSFLFGHRCQFV